MTHNGHLTLEIGPMAQRSIFFLCISLSLLCRASIVPAAEPPPATLLGQQELQEIFTEVVYQKTPFSTDDITIENFTSSPEDISLPAGELSYRVLPATQANNIGRKTMTVILAIDGRDQEKVKLTGDLHLFGRVLCSATSLPRNTILSEEDLSIIRRDISMLGPDIIQSLDQAIGKKLKVTLRPGAILFAHNLKDPAIVKRGDIVSIIARSRALDISVPGRVAENSGALGDVIRVKNLMSRREVFATVINSDEVLVDY